MGARYFSQRNGGGCTEFDVNPHCSVFTSPVRPSQAGSQLVEKERRKLRLVSGLL